MSDAVPSPAPGPAPDPVHGARRRLRRTMRWVAVVVFLALSFGGWALWQKVVGPVRLAAESGLPAHRRVAAEDLLLDEVRGPYRYRVADRSAPSLEVGLDNLGDRCGPVLQVPTVVGPTSAAIEVVVGIYAHRSLLLHTCDYPIRGSASRIVWVVLPLDAPVGDRAVLDGTTHRTAVRGE